MTTAQKLHQLFPDLQTNVSLADFTTFGVGGKAKFLLEIKDKYKLVEAVKIAKAGKLDYFVFAGGSNLVCNDKLTDRLFICYRTPATSRGSYEIFGQDITIDAGLPLAVLIAVSIKAGLAGLESLSGIPGTIGGAVYGNAGAYGVEIWSKIKTIEMFDGERIVFFKPTKETFAYRHSIFKTKSWLILAVTFKLKRGDGTQLLKLSKEIIKIRNEKYIPGIKCPGSYFKNPLVKNISQRSLKLIDQTKVVDGKIPAGYLLEAVGAKGLKQGKIQVADFHGNLIMNLGGGKARDVLKLADKLKDDVWQKFKIRLEEEVRLVK